jgi:polysaccharide export outer membrane protein
MGYISDAERDSAQRILTTYSNTIHPGDQLYIYVNSEMIESVIPFNQETHKEAVEKSRLNTIKESQASGTMWDTYRTGRVRQVSGYLVDDNGYITFPIIGKVYTAGIAYDSLQNLLQQKLIAGGYVNDPVVTVSPMNFRVSVVGEVRRPRELHVVGERLTIFEALAMCGDITDSGMRSNVVVMREKNGVVTPIEIDLTKKTIFESEVYYLQQNDIVYVEPNLAKKRRAELNQDWPKYVSSGVSVMTLLRHLLRRYYKIR